MVRPCADFSVTYAESPPMDITFGCGEDLAADFGEVIRLGDYEPYEGAYSVVPGQTAQVLATAGRVMADNVTVAAIPSNYGRITWNGAALRVE